jgi:four helix bundle protein
MRTRNDRVEESAISEACDVARTAIGQLCDLRNLLKTLAVVGLAVCTLGGMGHKKMSERGYEFACRLIDGFRAQKPADDAERRIWWQLLDSGYSIGSNASESDDGESGRDFIHKFAVSLKEGRETLYWLRLLAYAS